MTSDVRIAPKAAKEIARLDGVVRERVLVAIRALASEPRPDGCKKMRGNVESAYRIRVGDYRVVYEVTDRVRLVLVVKTGKRGDIY